MIFQHTIFTFGLKKANLRQNQLESRMMRQVSSSVRRGAGRKGRKDLARSLPSFKVLAVLFLGEVCSAFLPSKKACWAHQFRYLGVDQQYPSGFLSAMTRPLARACLWSASTRDRGARTAGHLTRARPASAGSSGQRCRESTGLPGAPGRRRWRGAPSLPLRIPDCRPRAPPDT